MSTRTNVKRLGSLAALAALVGVGIIAMPGQAQAWWRGGWCCGVGIGLYVPPIVVAPPAYYAPPPVYYAPPPAAYYPQQQGVWIPGHWQGGYWVPAHWG
jgi:hypothetical protein